MTLDLAPVLKHLSGIIDQLQLYLVIITIIQLEFWPSVCYGDEQDANEFYIRILDHLLEQLPNKYVYIKGRNNI